MTKKRDADTPAAEEMARLREQLEKLQEETSRLQNDLKRLEKENQDFANLYVQVQEQNEVLTNIYVASYRLHATLDPGGVMKIIQDILIELVGAEEFGIFLLDKEQTRLELVAGEGIRERLPATSLPSGEGVVGEVATSGEAFYFEPKSESEQEVGLPRAAIPMRMDGESVGVMVIYKLLSHKAGFSDLDHQLLELLAAHAATALVSARLHSLLDRKLKTMEGFIQLMRPKGKP
jgi:nitrate/nitrite-specific signal transduction histidine kinase